MPLSGQGGPAAATGLPRLIVPRVITEQVCQGTQADLRPRPPVPTFLMHESETNQVPPNQVTGQDFTLAFRTILARGRICAGHSINAWATHARVDPRSLNRFVNHGRAIFCGYAWRICTSLGLAFPDLIRQAVELAFETGPGGRPTVKGTARREKKSTLHHVFPCESGAFSGELSQRLATSVRECHLSLTDIAQISGLSRPSLSRLGQPGRDNHTLAYLFHDFF